MNFRLSMDWLCLTITIGITLLFGLMFAIQIIPLYATDPTKATTIGFILIAIYLYCFLYRPLGYSISTHGLRVSRPLKDFFIEYHFIQDIRIVSQAEMKFPIRIFGVGGLFGYFGLFYNSGIGRMRWFASRRNRTVLIETTKGKKIIITPDQPHLFVSIFESLRNK